jgi:hypothetical protein
MTDEVKQKIAELLNELKAQQDKYVKLYQMFQVDLANMDRHANQKAEELIELLLCDEDDGHGTMTGWWLYEEVEKVLYAEGSNGKEVIANVEKAEDFVEWMVTREITN